MTTFLLVATLLTGATLALMTFLASAAKHMPLSPTDNLPDTTNVQQWTDEQVKYFRVNVGLQNLYADVMATDPGDEQPEDAYSKKLRLFAEHEAELADKKAYKSAYHKAWYQRNKEARKAQVKARKVAMNKAAKREAANQRMREQQLAYWTPERKAEQSRLTTERMAAAKQSRSVIIAPLPAAMPVLTYSPETRAFTYGQRALA